MLPLMLNTLPPPCWVYTPFVDVLWDREELYVTVKVKACLLDCLKAETLEQVTAACLIGLTAIIQYF